jgi:hypothetical protein
VGSVGQIPNSRVEFVVDTQLTLEYPVNVFDISFVARVGAPAHSKLADAIQPRTNKGT